MCLYLTSALTGLADCIFFDKELLTGLIIVSFVVIKMMFYLQGGLGTQTTVDDTNMFKVVRHALDVCDFSQQQQQVSL